MKCYQCHREMGRNRYPMIYCRYPFCEKCGQQRQWRWGPTDTAPRVMVVNGFHIFDATSFVTTHVYKWNTSYTNGSGEGA